MSFYAVTWLCTLPTGICDFAFCCVFCLLVNALATIILKQILGFMPLILKYFMTSHDNWNYQRKKIYSVTHLCCKISLYFSRSKGDYVLQNYETVPKKLNIFMKLSISVTFYCTHPRPFCRFTPCHAELTCSHIGVRAQSTLGAQHFCPKNMYEKITKCPNFTRFLPEK